MLLLISLPLLVKAARNDGLSGRMAQLLGRIARSSSNNSAHPKSVEIALLTA